VRIEENDLGLGVDQLSGQAPNGESNPLPGSQNRERNRSQEKSEWIHFGGSHPVDVDVETETDTGKDMDTATENLFQLLRPASHRRSERHEIMPLYEESNHVQSIPMSWNDDDIPTYIPKR